MSNLVVPDWEKIKVIPFIKEGYHDLNFKTPEKGSFTSAPPYTQQSRALITQFNTVLKSLNKDGTYDGEGPFQTLIIDSLTSMFQIWKEMIMSMNMVPQLRKQDYGTLYNLTFGQLLPQLKTINQKIPYIVLITHEFMEKDDITSKIVEFPVGASQNQGKLLGKEFDEIYRQKVNGKVREWRTAKDGHFEAGSRLDLPNPISPATFQRLMEIAKEKGKDVSRLFFLLCGNYKTGKTVSACTFPKPGILLDWDNGFTSVKNTEVKS